MPPSSKGLQTRDGSLRTDWVGPQILSRRIDLAVQNTVRLGMIKVSSHEATTTVATQLPT